MISEARLQQMQAQVDEGGTLKCDQELLVAIDRYREALTNIAVTAQQASTHEPEQFCQWAYNYASEALAPQDLPSRESDNG